MEIGDENIANYLKRTIEDFKRDHNTLKFIRRLHIKQVHLMRKNKRRLM